jgi:pimeloyl-ACP methyl ester carboxylesterase
MNRVSAPTGLYCYHEHMKEQNVQIELAGTIHTVACKLRQQGPDDFVLVFFNGVGCIKECFDAAFTADPLQGRSILTFDYLGFGASSKPKDFPYTLEAHAAIAKALFQELQLTRIVMIGHSMGAAIGLLLAQDLDTVVNFINVEGALVQEDISSAARGVIGQSEEMFIETGFEAFKQALRNSGRRDLATWAEWLTQADGAALYRSMRSMVQWPDDPRLLEYFNALPQKAYIYGDERAKDYLLPRLHRTAVYRLANCGHFMMLDDPTAFYRAIEQAL